MPDPVFVLTTAGDRARHILQIDRSAIMAGQQEQFYIACALQGLAGELTAVDSETGELLGEPSRPVDEIASVLGYSDAANFTRAFKKWAGVTPSRYRKSLTGTLPF